MQVNIRNRIEYKAAILIFTEASSTEVYICTNMYCIVLYTRVAIKSCHPSEAPLFCPRGSCPAFPASKEGAVRKGKHTKVKGSKG